MGEGKLCSLLASVPIDGVNGVSGVFGVVI